MSDTPDPAASPTEPPAPAPGPPPARHRPPPGRINPEELAAARKGGAQEGLVWLGRDPWARGPWLYHGLRLVVRFIAFVVLRFQLRTEGQEHLPRS